MVRLKNNWLLLFARRLVNWRMTASLQPQLAPMGRSRRSLWTGMQITRISYGCCSCWNWSGGWSRPPPSDQSSRPPVRRSCSSSGGGLTPNPQANRTLLWIQHVRLPIVRVALIVPFLRIWHWNIVILISRLGLVTLPIYALPAHRWHLQTQQHGQTQTISSSKILIAADSLC